METLHLISKRQDFDLDRKFIDQTQNSNYAFSSYIESAYLELYSLLFFPLRAMPAVAFGLGKSASKPSNAPFTLGRNHASTSQKRKNLFADDEDNSINATQPRSDDDTRPKKSPKLTTCTMGKEDKAPLSKLNDQHHNGEYEAEPPTEAIANTNTNGKSRVDTYKSLASLRDASLHAAQANAIDTSIYDYDAGFDTFSSTANSVRTKTSSSMSNAAPGEAKYMGSLLAAASTRKRDLLRAEEKKLQREREKEGDEFAGTEKFVTSAYRKQQEENRRLEEDEARREKEEEERRRKGGGMREWHSRMLEREEEKMRGIEENVKRKAAGEMSSVEAELPIQAGADEEQDQKKMAAALNEKGGHVVINAEGEIVDKRQLLSAGLNVAKKPQQTSPSATSKLSSAINRPGQFGPDMRNAQDARHSQRERQTRMLERQIEQMEVESKKAEEEEQRHKEEKIKSAKTEEDKMSAKERYLARKREREEEARKHKDGG